MNIIISLYQNFSGIFRYWAPTRLGLRDKPHTIVFSTVNYNPDLNMANKDGTNFFSRFLQWANRRFGRPYARHVADYPPNAHLDFRPLTCPPHELFSTSQQPAYGHLDEPHGWFFRGTPYGPPFFTPRLWGHAPSY